MSILDISIVLFCIMEFSNIIILYFFPLSKKGNGVAVFDNFTKEEDESKQLFNSYMACWVAGCKLIFLVLLITIVFLGDDTLKLVAVGTIILSIATYFFRLDKIITKLDKMGKISPKGYSKILRLMIIGFMLMFAVALVVSIITL